MDWMATLVGGLLLAVFGFALNRISKLNEASQVALTKDMIRLKRELDEFEVRLRSGMSRAEVRELLNDKLEPIYLLLKEIKEDIRNSRLSND